VIAVWVQSLGGSADGWSALARPSRGDSEAWRSGQVGYARHALHNSLVQQRKMGHLDDSRPRRFGYPAQNLLDQSSHAPGGCRSQSPHQPGGQLLGELGHAAALRQAPATGPTASRVTVSTRPFLTHSRRSCRPVCVSGCYAPPRAQWLGPTQWLYLWHSISRLHIRESSMLSPVRAGAG